MEEVTFAADCQLNDHEDWIREGTKVKVFNSALKRDDSIPVVITQALGYRGEVKDIYDVVWFMKEAFIEFQ